MAPLKEFAWSYSKLKNFETCPKRHLEVDIKKSFVEDTENLKWGNSAHDALAKACAGKAPLPDDFNAFQKWIDAVRGGPGQLLVEQKYAIKRDFGPCTWFDHKTWYRGIADVVRVSGQVALAIDWKTGKVLSDSVQLMLMAQCIFTHFPEVQRVRTEFVWLAHDCTTPEVYSRQDVADGWVALLPRVQRLEQASKDQSYPPKPGRLCKNWCPVSSCPHNGK